MDKLYDLSHPFQAACLSILVMSQFFWSAAAVPTRRLHRLQPSDWAARRHSSRRPLHFVRTGRW